MDGSRRIDLRILPTDSVLAHEVADPARERRIEHRLRQDGILRDPLLVGAVPGLDQFVLLDGTNRKHALAALSLPLLMAQVIDYADEHAVELRTWCHAAAVPTETILTAAQDTPGAAVESLPALAAADALHDAATLAVIVNAREQYAVTRNHDSQVARADQLLHLVDSYETRMERMDCVPEEIEERVRLIAPETVLVAFPVFTRSQVVAMATRTSLIPAGITRHVIRGGRALRVNLPLDVLREPDLAAAESVFQEHLRDLHPRYYHEPTILFDS